MAYEVLARKWRPKQFAEVVGQPHVVQTLTNAIRIGRVAHAYLFVGPRGVGKTSIARIFAKALNCCSGISPTPCGKCDACEEIARGGSLDVHELDAASNRGIDEIRALRDTIRYMPTRRFKIYIIDEVHMLTMEAFNALLKTLEEPPEHVKFFMATTEPQKVPATILSRCQRFDLRRIPLSLLVERLRLIAQDEALTIDEDALLAIARVAEGALRDAESALDLLISFQGKEIHEEAVLAAFGLVAREALENLSSCLLQGDVTGVIQQVEALDQNGKDMPRLLLELLEHCRNLLVYLHSGEAVVKQELTPGQLAVLKTQAALTNTERLLRIADILMETSSRLPYALSQKTLLETALIRCSRSVAIIALDEVLRRIEDLRRSLADATLRNGPAAAGLQPSFARHSGLRDLPTPAGAGFAKAGGGSTSNSAPPALAPAEPAASSSSAPAKSSVSSPGDSLDKPSVKPPGDAPDGDELAHLVKVWPELVEQIGKAVPLARGCLLDARPAAVQADRVTIGFDPEFAERMEQAGLPRTRTALQKNLSAVLRRSVTVDFKLFTETVSNEGAPAVAKAMAGRPAVASAKAEAPSGKAMAGQPGGKPSLQQKQKWFKDPAVQQTMDMFNGDIQEVRE